MGTQWKTALFNDAKAVGYTVDADSTTALYVKGVPYTRDDGGIGAFDLEIPRRNGSDEGVSHQALVTGWVGKTVKISNRDMPSGVDTVNMSLKNSTRPYENIYDQALFYIQKLGVGGVMTASPEEKWKDVVRNMRVAVIGSGGTGMHLVDGLSKCNVAAIEVWDGDTIEDRNTWRWPGSQRRWASLIGKNKAEACSGEYTNVRTVVNHHNEMVLEDNVSVAVAADYVFVAIDCDESRRRIIEACEQTNTPCIDVGMGVKVWGGELQGNVRVHLYSDGEYSPHKTSDNAEAQEAYAATEVPEANALNAMLAITEWRRMTGQYRAHKNRTMVKYHLDWAAIYRE